MHGRDGGHRIPGNDEMINEQPRLCICSWLPCLTRKIKQRNYCQGNLCCVHSPTFFVPLLIINMMVPLLRTKLKKRERELSEQARHTFKSLISGWWEILIFIKDFFLEMLCDAVWNRFSCCHSRCQRGFCAAFPSFGEEAKIRVTDLTCNNEIDKRRQTDKQTSNKEYASFVQTHTHIHIHTNTHTGWNRHKTKIMKGDRDGEQKHQKLQKKLLSLIDVWLGRINNHIRDKYKERRSLVFIWV